jgi:hypothetical protein
VISGELVGRLCMLLTSGDERATLWSVKAFLKLRCDSQALTTAGEP